MTLRYIAGLALTSLLFILTAACGSPTEEEIRICESETPTQARPVTEQLACIHDVVQYKLDQGLEYAYSPSIVAGKSSLTYRAALHSLVASDYLVEVATFRPKGEATPQDTQGVPGYYLTAEGMDYLRRHRYPVRYWLDHNWFPLAVAVVNGVLGFSVIVMQLLQFRRRRGTG